MHVLQHGGYNHLRVSFGDPGVSRSKQAKESLCCAKASFGAGALLGGQVVKTLLPFSPSGGALPFHLLSKLYERTSVVITTNLSFSEWAQVLGDAKMTTALPDRLTHRYYILETGNDSYRFKASSEAVAKTTKEATTLTKA